MKFIKINTLISIIFNLSTLFLIIIPLGHRDLTNGGYERYFLMLVMITFFNLAKDLFNLSEIK